MEIQEIPRKRVRKEVRKKPGNCLDVALLAKHQEAITSPKGSTLQENARKVMHARRRARALPRLPDPIEHGTLSRAQDWNTANLSDMLVDYAMNKRKHPAT